MSFQFKRFFRVISFLLLGLLLSIFPLSVLGQGGISLVLYPPNLELFPKVTLFLDAYDAQGQFIPSLDLNSFKIYEDGFERTLNETQLLEPGRPSLLLIWALPQPRQCRCPDRYEGLFLRSSPG
jgi:hypothetical protein